jgi:release factor glutamine methyltransferase
MTARKLFKKIASLILVPVMNRYLRKDRKYTYKDIKLLIYKGVFHPGFFHSTRFLAGFLVEQPLKEKSVLELGCGSGLLSVIASQTGALVTASDLNKIAIENVKHNAKLNQVSITVIHSDLFDSIEGEFDFIIINPPYYPKKVETDSELAWHCGEDFNYFRKLFSQLNAHIHSESKVIMVLTKGCDLKTIFDIASHNNFKFDLLRERNVLFDEKDFLFSIRPSSFS